MRRQLIAAGLVLLLAACGSHGGSRDDAPVGKIHEAPRPVWLAPDQFMNIAAWCIGVDGVYAHTRNPAPPIIIRDDPNCAEGGVLYETRDDV